MSFDAKDAIPSLWDVLGRPFPTNTWTLGSSTLGWSNVFTYELDTKPTLVAALPSAVIAGAGARRFVSDATVTTFASIVAGTGGNAVPVYSDGTSWRIG